MRNRILLLLIPCLLLGCSSSGTSGNASQPQKSAEPAPPEMKTGLSAFQQLYPTARQWAADAQPVSLESEAIKSIPVKEGKAAEWRGLFASPAKNGLKPYTWLGTTLDADQKQGVTPGNEDTYSASNRTTRIFSAGQIKIDSDQAFSVAQEHGGKALLAKSPDMPVSFVLSGDVLKNQLTWFVIYGANTNEPKLKIAVNCQTGDYEGVVK